MCVGHVSLAFTASWALGSLFMRASQPFPPPPHHGPCPSSNSAGALVLLLPPRVSAGIWKDPNVTAGWRHGSSSRRRPPAPMMEPLRLIPPITSGHKCSAVVQSVPCGFTWERLKCSGDTSWHWGVRSYWARLWLVRQEMRGSWGSVAPLVLWCWTQSRGGRWLGHQLCLFVKQWPWVMQDLLSASRHCLPLSSSFFFPWELHFLLKHEHFPI